MTANRTLRLVAGATIAFASVLLASGCSPRDFLTGQIVREQEKYLGPAGAKGVRIEKLTAKVYTFQWKWYRNIVVRTDAGWVVIDSFNPAAASELADALFRIAPGLPVHTLVYSHYHLDHVGGGAALQAQNVLADEKCPGYWKDLEAQDPEFWKARMEGFAPATELMKGDRTLEVGGVRLELLHLGKTHTDTLYAVHIPEEELLFSADFGFVRGIPPMGGPDYYFPGAMKAAERLAALDFEIWVPSHFGHGKKADFEEYFEFIAELQRRIKASILKYAGTGPIPTDADTIEALFFEVYEPMKERYSGWHGFEQQILFTQIRHLVGVTLGY